MSDIQVGRLTLRETQAISESAYQGWSLHISGIEVCPLVTREEVWARFDGALGSQDELVPVIFQEKEERNGYYTVLSSSGEVLDRKRQGITEISWKLSLQRHGPDSDVDLESRLIGATRQNDFNQVGERWSAPSIGAYGYYTGATQPALLTRSGADGPITVFRGVSAGVNPRWGCDVEHYLRGRVKILTEGTERVGTGHPLRADQWELSNGLARVRPLSGGSLEVASFANGRWHGKKWRVQVGAEQVTRWQSAGVLRNDLEQCVIRLTALRSPVGRAYLDMTLRRGSRIVECWLQRGDSGSMSVYLTDPEALTDSTSHAVRGGDDADGNRVAVGSARHFNLHPSGGLTKTNATSMDCWLGVVVGGGAAVAGDRAADLQAQYIGAIPEVVAAVRR
ncbi:hypothetical protein [Nonomuraea fuscirosea]|uniref:hypothetical protein n=1 Tax=Nonomuraea fuscirosea TaxID=1291556 RepID=UPI0033EA4ECC